MGTGHILDHIWLDSVVGFTIIEIETKIKTVRVVDRSFSNFFTYSNLFNHQTALYMHVQLLSPFYTLGTRTQRDLTHYQKLQLTSGRAVILRKGVGIQPLCSSPLHSTTSKQVSGNIEILHNLHLLIICLPTPSYLGWKKRIQKDPLEKY